MIYWQATPEACLIVGRSPAEHIKKPLNIDENIYFSSAIAIQLLPRKPRHRTTAPDASKWMVAVAQYVKDVRAIIAIQSTFLFFPDFHFSDSMRTLFINGSRIHSVKWTGSALVVFMLIAVYAAPSRASDLRGQDAAPEWEHFNRSVGVSIGVRERTYTEFDSRQLTPDGILDEESGAIKTGDLQLRLQGSSEAFPAWLQAMVTRTWGQTAYRGYLQSGTTLTPFQAKTGNVMLDASIRIGLPQQIGSATQAIVYITASHQKWKRNLAQYSEDYRHRTLGIGMLAQRRVNKALIIEGDVSFSKILDAKISVPLFNFNNAVPGKHELFAGAGLTYTANPTFSVALKIVSETYRYHASSIVNGVRLPASKSQNKVIAVQANHHY